MTNSGDARNKLSVITISSNRIKQNLPLPIRKLFYNAYVLLYLDYCCTIWRNANNEFLNTVIKFQKCAARSILDKPIDIPSSEMFAELNCLTYPERVNYQKAVLMFIIMHGLTPSYLHNLFQFTSEIHNRSLRSISEDLLYIPKPKLEIYRNTPTYSVSKIWKYQEQWLSSKFQKEILAMSSISILIMSVHAVHECIYLVYYLFLLLWCIPHQNCL